MIWVLIGLIANIIKATIGIPSYLIGCYCSDRRGLFSEYNRELDVLKDKYGNYLCQYFFNFVLIKQPSKNKFGNPLETISSVLGKNQVSNNLTFLGWVIVLILGVIEKNHCIKSIDNNY